MGAPGLIVVLIGMPAVDGILKNRAPTADGLLTFAGLLVFMIGLDYETVADAQLQAFLALDQRPAISRLGLDR